jgi:thioester reductase-like protein
VLLTGATGFLGGYLLATLLAETDWDIYCLVRAKDAAAASTRVLASLAKTCRSGLGWQDRIHAVCGDVSDPHFGLCKADYQELAKRVQIVLHNAALVNWIKSYKALRAINVLGTLHAIEFACEGHAKPMGYLSTMAVCYAKDGPDCVDESTDMTPHAEGIPLGYAQTKCVSESLLRQANARGLPVTIIRPTLICGDAETGRTHEDDFISRLVKGCIALGAAHDIDWMIDCSPVDVTARIVVSSLRHMANGFRVIHVRHPNPRPWREMVLWLNLIGYRVRLVPLDIWLQQVEAMPREQCSEFYLLRSFFLSRPPMLAGRCQMEIYLEDMRRNIHSDASNRWIAESGLALPPLDARMISRYFNAYVETGFLPAMAQPPTVQQACGPDRAFIELAMRLRHSDPCLHIIHHTATPLGQGSIINELCSLRTGAAVGLWLVRGEHRSAATAMAHPFELVVKVKTDDTVPLEIVESIASLRDGPLAEHAIEIVRALGLTAAHERELALYTSAPPVLSRIMPQIFATQATQATQGSLGSGSYMVAMEFLRDADMLDSIAAGKAWTTMHIRCAIHDLATIHSVWYEQEKALCEFPWILPPLDVDAIKHRMPFWHALAETVAPVFDDSLGTLGSLLHQRYLRTMPEWWQTLRSMPHTLIHNDFNPRNLAFRREGGSLRLCAYDWELAGIGMPQHDLAELLCFTLTEGCTPDDILAHLDLHRLCLQESTGSTINPDQWRLGFRLSLRYLLVSRLALYALYHQTSPQSFLPAVLMNWKRLHCALEIFQAVIGERLVPDPLSGS